VHPFEIMAEPVRRRIVDILASGEHTCGQIAAVVRNEFGISPTAVSKHLMKMLDSGFVDVREECASRYYRLSDRAIERLETEVRALRRKWWERIGWNETGDPMIAGIEAPRAPRQRASQSRPGQGPFQVQLSRRGRRGADHSSDGWSWPFSD